MSSIRSAITTRCARAAAMVALVIGVASGSSGQGFGQDPTVFESPVDSKDIEQMGVMLELDEAQMSAMQDLHGAMAARFQKAHTQMMAAIESMSNEYEETKDPTVWQEYAGMQQDFSDHRKAIQADFFEDAKLLLTADQMAEWPRFERFHRRAHGLRSRGPFVISGLTVDLVRIANELELNAEQEEAIAGVLEQYERDMDRALMNLEKVERELAEESKDIGIDWMNNMDKLDELWSQGRDASIRVRDVNLRYQRQLQLSLEAEQQAEFDEQFNEIAYPTIYRRTSADKAFSTIKEMDDLTPEQLEQIEEIRTVYERDLTTLRSEWVETQRETETEMSIQDLFAKFGPGGGADEHTQRQTEIVDSTYERLRQALTEEQREALPAKSTRGQFQRPTFGDD